MQKKGQKRLQIYDKWFFTYKKKPKSRTNFIRRHYYLKTPEFDIFQKSRKFETKNLENTARRQKQKF